MLSRRIAYPNKIPSQECAWYVFCTAEEASMSGVQEQRGREDKAQLGHRVKSYWDTKTNKWVVNIRATRRFKMDELDKALNWRDEVRYDLGLPKAKDKYKL